MFLAISSIIAIFEIVPVERGLKKIEKKYDCTKGVKDFALVGLEHTLKILLLAHLHPPGVKAREPLEVGRSRGRM